MAELRAEGKVRHVGVSNVDVEQLATAASIVPVVSVQNRYNLAERDAEPVLQVCERDGLAFLPWYPLASADLAKPGGALDDVATRLGVPPAHVALAWLLRHSPVALPIPGTSSVAHLEQNLAAGMLVLGPRELEELDDIGGTPAP
jgi:pyridoxine 4-dehydrogenase